MVCADGEKILIRLFHSDKNGLFFLQKSSVAREFLEAYDDEVIILRLVE